MSQLSEIPAVEACGRTISVHDIFYSLLINEKLDETLRPSIEEIIIRKKADELGLQATEEELQTMADATRMALDLHKAADALQWLEESGMSTDDFENRLDSAIIRGKVRDEVVKDKVEAYFAENRFAYDKAKLSQIVVDSEDVATELMTQIEEDDADFGKLVERFSTHEESKKEGGSVGMAVRSSLSPSVQQAVFNGAEGDVVGPLKTDMGYHLIRIDEIHFGELSGEVLTSIQSDLFDQWLDEEFSKAGVKMVLFGSGDD